MHCANIVQMWRFMCGAENNKRKARDEKNEKAKILEKLVIGKLSGFSYFLFLTERMRANGQDLLEVYNESVIMR